MIKAIVFDMDGVLIDAKDWHYEALNKSLLLFGYSINRFEHLTTYDGLPTRRKLEMLTMERGLPKELHEFINEMKQLYTTEIVNARCKPTFVHEFALSKFKAEGYKLGVASNSVRSTVHMMMEKACLDGYLDWKLSNEDVVNPKPDPEIYLKAIQQLNLEPHEVLVIEDNDHGVKAGIASGAHVMVVKDVDEVSYQNIMARISELNGAIE